MTWVRSAEQIDTPWRALIMATATAVALPSAVGLACLAVFAVTREAVPPQLGLILWVLGTALLLSPMVSLPAVMLALPVTSLLVRLGWFGLLPALAVGAATGAGAGLMMGFPAAAGVGALILLILRAVLERLTPEAPPAH